MDAATRSAMSSPPGRCAANRAIALMRRASLRRCLETRRVGDAVQPGSRIGPALVVRVTPLERDAKHLAQQVVGLRADTPDEVAKDHACVTVEELGEPGGITQ